VIDGVLCSEQQKQTKGATKATETETETATQAE